MKNLFENKNIPIVRFLIRLVPFTILIILIFYVISPFYLRLFLPFFANEIEMLHPEYDVVDYDIVKAKKLNYVQIMIEINKRPDPHDRLKGKITRHKAQASSLCIYPIIVISLILSWLGLSFRQRLKALLISIPLIFLVSSLDLPLIFIGDIKSYLHPNDKGLHEFWAHFINNGGRQFLAILVFMLAIAPYYIKKAPKNIFPDKVGRNDPCPCGSGKKYKNCCMGLK